MKIIQQTKDNTCLACVLAMIVNESEQYVLDWFVHQDPPFHDEDAFLFLAHHGIFLALGFNFKPDHPDGVDLTDIHNITAEINIKERMAYLVVDSLINKEYTHAIFLKDGKIYDPLFEEPQKLDNYKVRWAYPLLITEQRHKLFLSENNHA